MSKVKAKLKPYGGLNCNFTKVSNTMFFHIKDVYNYRVYSYLCLKYNSNYNYAFPSYNTIANDCGISLSKAKQCIKWLCQQGYVVKAKYNNGKNINNVYYIRYLEIEQKTIDELLTEDVELEIELFGNIIDMNEELNIEIEC